MISYGINEGANVPRLAMRSPKLRGKVRFLGCLYWRVAHPVERSAVNRGKMVRVHPCQFSLEGGKHGGFDYSGMGR